MFSPSKCICILKVGIIINEPNAAIVMVPIFLKNSNEMNQALTSGIDMLKRWKDEKMKLLYTVLNKFG